MNKHIVIVGGSYTGATVAIQLSRHARKPLRISVVEPRETVGQGLPYSSPDPDHRLNASDKVQFVTPDDQEHLRRWFAEQGGSAYDAAAEVDDGPLFLRRADFGRFVAEQFATHQMPNPSKSAIHHVHGRALDIAKQGETFRIALEGGETIDADMAVVATSNERPSIPASFAASVASHPGFHADPWDLAAIQRIPEDAKLLFIGTALTAADLIVTRLRLGHRGSITAMSRRGLRSTARPKTGGGISGPFWDRFVRETSLFVARHGRHRRLLDVIKALRADIREAETRGEPWQAPFDELRDSVWQVSPHLPLEEQRRFMRHLRPWYDVHRFRLPPQVETTLDDAVARGQLRYRAARILSASGNGQGIAVEYRERNSNAPQTATFHAVINCTGPEPRPDRTGNRFMQALVARGLARVHPVGIGFDVDDRCAAVGADGNSDPRLRVFGPLTIGQFGDPQGTPFILGHICRVMPEIVAMLETD